MTAIHAIRLVSVDAERLAEFYTRHLGFRHDGAVEAPHDEFGASARRLVRLSLGRECIEVIEFETPGRPAPPIAANDVRFQHFAMIAADMDRAHARLVASAGWTAITCGGPQTLPESSGGVAAFKFRDPEGHPLELLSFPGGRAPAVWRKAARQANPGATLLGIDHTAIVVSDTEVSIAHYAETGFERSGMTLNEGSEQAALDGIGDPHVEVTTLRGPDGGPPHLELLCYRDGTTGGDVFDRDALATRVVMVSGGTARRDPDGHRWIVAS